MKINILDYKKINDMKFYDLKKISQLKDQKFYFMILPRGSGYVESSKKTSKKKAEI